MKSAFKSRKNRPGYYYSRPKRQYYERGDAEISVLNELEHKQPSYHLSVGELRDRMDQKKFLGLLDMLCEELRKELEA